MTRHTDSESDETTQTMADISHTSPYTGETTGHLFTRGPVVAADGGRSVDDEETADDAETRSNNADERTMKSVSHTPPTEPTTEGRRNRVFERGVRDTDEDEDHR